MGGLTWSDVCTGLFSMRIMPRGFIFDSCAPTLFSDTEDEKYILALYNTKVAQLYLDFLAPTIHYTCGSVVKLPFVRTQNFDGRLVNESIALASQDWDSYETSWDFRTHPLVANQRYAAANHPNEKDSPEHHLYAAYQMWLATTERRFQQLKANEEKLNRIFIDIYGLQDELTPEVADKDVTVHRIFYSKDDVPESMKGSSYVRTMRDEIVSLVSYAVGCMLGRYSLDVEGLAFAGGEWDASKYKTYIPDKDGILPITDDEYFGDDIVGRFEEFIKTVYGEDTLEENLRFVADALGGSGSSREVIRRYFLNDFYADHLKTYQKRPIYWLFDSGKKNGFKCLIYMHRYRPDTIARIRTDYVHEQQSRYRTAIADLEKRIANASTAERVKLTKQLAGIKAQADELHSYEEKIHHYADRMIPIDLDDGVKVNYAKFADVLAKIK